MDEKDITLGEVHRVCVDIRDRVDAINGRVQAHETRLSILEDRENRGAKLGGFWGAIGGFVSGLLSSWGLGGK